MAIKTSALNQSNNENVTYPHSQSDRSHDVQNLCISGLWHVAIIIAEDSIEQLRNKALIDAFHFLRLLDVRLHEFEDLFLDGSEAADLWCLGGNQS
jgi:hypothetical protein